MHLTHTSQTQPAHHQFPLNQKIHCESHASRDKRVMFGCYTEKAPSAWRRQGTQKTENTYNQHKRPPIGTTHRPSTRHHRKGRPRFYLHNTNQLSSPVPVHVSSSVTSRHHYAHPAGSSPDPLSQRSPMRSAGRVSHTTTQTPSAPETLQLCPQLSSTFPMYL